MARQEDSEPTEETMEKFVILSKKSVGFMYPYF
jgi:hypothetical protein